MAPEKPYRTYGDRLANQTLFSSVHSVHSVLSVVQNMNLSDVLSKPNTQNKRKNQQMKTVPNLLKAMLLSAIALYATAVVYAVGCNRC